MPVPPLSCTVRDCALLLQREGDTYRCARRHSYDVARAGYVNLLQPQDRKSLDAGDRRESVQARADLLTQGIGSAIVGDLAERARRLTSESSVVVDLGCGSGELLSTVTHGGAIAGVGVDLSTAAADLAARRFPHLTWVVANADRRIPLLDRSADLILSLHGRRHAGDSARVLTRDGHLLIGVPASDDLVELRERVLGEAIERNRADTVIAEHAPHFEVLERFTLRERHLVTREQLRDLLRGTYRGERRGSAERIAGIDSLEVTLASEVVLLRRR